MKRLSPFAGRLADRVLNNRSVIALTLIVMIAAVLIVRECNTSEPSVRITGMILQLLSAIPTVIGIVQISNRYPRTQIELATNFADTSKFETALADGEADSSVKSIEVRIQRLETDVRDMRNYFRGQAASILASIENHSRNISAKFDEQGQRTSTLEATLKSSQIGGRYLSAAAIVLLCMGTVMTSMSSEWHAWFGKTTSETSVAAQVRIQPRLSAGKIFLK